jgi:hypothetical protein
VNNAVEEQRLKAVTTSWISTSRVFFNRGNLVCLRGDRHYSSNCRYGANVGINTAAVQVSLSANMDELSSLFRPNMRSFLIFFCNLSEGLSYESSAEVSRE